jgi:hypothetical protein
MELNEFGKRVWKHKVNRRLFLEQSYRWVKDVYVIEESEDCRRLVESYSLTTVDLSEWVPMSKQEFDTVKYYYREIYNNV